jgi:type IV pilus assembly protein PilB
MQVAESELKTFILDSGLVSRKDVEDADTKAKSSKQSIGDVLVSNGQLSSDALRRIQAYVLGIPFLSLKDAQIPFEVLSLIPEPIARSHNIIAYKKNADSLEVAMLDTQDLAAIDSVRKKTGLTIQARLTDDDSIKHALLQYQNGSRQAYAR